MLDDTAYWTWKHAIDSSTNPYIRSWAQLCWGMRDEVMNQNKHVKILMVGPGGSGKSWGGISTGVYIDPTLTVEERVVSGRYGMGEFMKLINRDTSPLVKGNVVIVDEAGVAVPVREFQSEVNNAIDEVNQTFRYRNLVIIFTTPFPDLIDSHLQKSFDWLFEYHKHIDKVNRLSSAKPFGVEYNGRTKKLYHKFPSCTLNGHTFQVQRIKVPAPPKELTDVYEPMAADFKRKLSKISEIRVNQDLEKYKGKYIIAEDIADSILQAKGSGLTEDIIKYRPSGPYVNRYDVMTAFKCSETVARMVISTVLRKLGGGYSV